MSEKGKPRLSRLTSILLQLQSKRVLTATEIAEKHGVSIRTIYRDIRTLEDSGVPIFTEEGKGYSLIEGYSLPPIMFSEEEANALITAEKLILKNKDHSLRDQYQKAISKIKSVLKITQKEKIELLEKRVYYRNKTGPDDSSNNLIKLQKAIVSYQLCQIKYQSLEGKITERKVEPFALFSTNENWLLIAYCRLRKSFRAFRLDQIQKLEQRLENFPPHKITLEEYFEQCKNQRN